MMYFWRLARNEIREMTITELIIFEEQFEKINKELKDGKWSKATSRYRADW